MKIGFDIHGVIDYNPKRFSILSKKLIADVHEVHIITGSMKNESIENQLKELGIHYTNFFSVSDYLISKGEKVTFTDPDNPWFESDAWNRAKGEYCKSQKIDIHFDDTRMYGNFFDDCVFVHCKKSNFGCHHFEVISDDNGVEKFKQFHVKYFESKVEKWGEM